MRHRLPLSQYGKGLSVCFSLCALAVTGASPLLPGDILVSSSTNFQDSTISEYTRTGVLVQTFTVPLPPGGDTYARDIATDSLGRINVWNGTFQPFLTTMTPGVLPGSSASVQNTLAGWSTANATYFGGIAVGGNYAYVTDMSTFGSSTSQANGIIRFDLTTFAAVRFAQGVANGSGDYIDLNLGRDGLLYALYPGGSPAGNKLDVINPQTMTLLRTLNLPVSLGAIAVDQNGSIYGTSPFNPSIFRFNAAGAMTGSILTDVGGLSDLDLADDGTLLTTSNNGKVVLSDTSLAAVTSFTFRTGIITSFAAFTTPPSTVPEPSSVALLLSGGVLAAIARWRSRAAG